MFLDELKEFQSMSPIESAVACSLVGESFVAADEPKEDVWKGVLRLQEKRDKMDERRGAKIRFSFSQMPA